jgi:hypothetical protein
MATLTDLFLNTNGGDSRISIPDPINHLDPSGPYLTNFSTPYISANEREGAILNPYANLLPTTADQYRDSSNFNDFRLGNGLGISKAFRKQDSQPGNGDWEGSFYGMVKPTKNFGRSDVTPDLNNRRVDNTERARMSFKKLGFKPNEKPKNAYYQPWEWYPVAGYGDPNVQNNSNYNRNYGLPDADAVARRMYQPAPSRLTKMLSTDTEDQSLRPQQTLMHPMKVVSEDRQRQKFQRIPKNTDVAEAVIYENIHPRGMGAPNLVEAPRVHADARVIRQPIGSNDTGSKAVFDRLGNQGPGSGNEMLVETLEDSLLRFKTDQKYVQGHDIDAEMQMYLRGEEELNGTYTPDPFDILRSAGSYEHDRSTINTPVHLQQTQWP